MTANNLVLSVLAVCSTVIVVGCDDDNTGTDAAVADMSAAVDLKMGNPMDMSASVDMHTPRAKTIPLTFEPYGLWWDSTSSTLFLSSSENQVYRWTDPTSAPVLFATISTSISPAPGALGQLVRLSNGNLLVTIMGDGTAGGIAQIDSNGTATAIAGLDPTRVRNGLTVDSSGTVYDAWIKGATGGVSTVSLSGGGETDIVLNLKKPQGVVSVGANLAITDQSTKELIVTPANNALPDLGIGNVLAVLFSPTLLTAGPSNDFFVGGPAVVYRVDSKGQVLNFAIESNDARGVAFDGGKNRLFVAVPDPTTADLDGGITAVLQIFQVSL